MGTKPWRRRVAPAAAAVAVATAGAAAFLATRRPTTRKASAAAKPDPPAASGQRPIAPVLPLRARRPTPAHRQSPPPADDASVATLTRLAQGLAALPTEPEPATDAATPLTPPLAAAPAPAAHDDVATPGAQPGRPATTEPTPATPGDAAAPAPAAPSDAATQRTSRRRPATTEPTPATPGDAAAHHAPPGPAAPAPPAPGDVATLRARPGQPATPSDAAARHAPPGQGVARRGRVVVAGVVLVGVVVGGVVAVVAAQRDSDGGRAASGGATGAGTTAVSAPPSTVGAPAAGVVFSQAGARLAEAGSFRYSGAVSAFDVSAVRPSLWLAVNLAVTGQVVTTDGRLHEVAVANTGQATETVAAGEQVWGRSAPGPDGLGDASYELIPGLAGARGAAFLPAWLAAATDPTDAGLDPQGRPTYRATVPASVIGPVERGRAAADAVITLSVDRDGTPAHVDIVAPAGDDPRLHLAIDLAGLGEPVTIDPPG